jgi:hypothetical protein
MAEHDDSENAVQVYVSGCHPACGTPPSSLRQHEVVVVVPTVSDYIGNRAE